MSYIQARYSVVVLHGYDAHVSHKLSGGSLLGASTLALAVLWHSGALRDTNEKVPERELKEASRGANRRANL
jgi:hypothetical protein